MKTVFRTVLSLVLISSISCKDLKKEDTETQAAIEEIETVENEIDEATEEVDKNVKELEEALNELDND